MIYAVLDSNGDCVNRVVWDGDSSWECPEGHTAVADPDNTYKIKKQVASTPTSSDPFASLSDEQKQQILDILNITPG